MTTDEDHVLSTFNRRAILASTLCGCYHCLEKFLPSAVEEWADDERGEDFWTALCPSCNFDSVVGSASGVEISDGSLYRMRLHHFGDFD